MKVQFADCALDVGARRILRKDREVHLSPKAFELLVVLVERRGEAVSKPNCSNACGRGCSFPMPASRASSRSFAMRSETARVPDRTSTWPRGPTGRAGQV